MNLTVNGAFTVWQMVDLYKRFTGMDGESPVANYIQNSNISYVKEGTLKFSVYIATLRRNPSKPIRRKRQKEKTARTSINTGFLVVLAEKKGFEPLRQFPDLLP